MMGRSKVLVFYLFHLFFLPFTLFQKILIISDLNYLFIPL